MKMWLLVMFACLTFNILPAHSQNVALFGDPILAEIPGSHIWYEFLEMDVHASLKGDDVALKQTIYIDKFPIPSVIDKSVNYLQIWKLRAIDWPALALYIDNTSDEKISRYWYYEYVDGKWKLAKHLVGSGDVISDVQELNKFLKEKYKLEWKYRF